MCSASDCFELGRQSYITSDHYHTVLWMTEALDRLELQDPNSADTVSRADILEYLAFSSYMQGHVKHALKLTDELLQLRPDHQRAKGNKVGSFILKTRLILEYVNYLLASF